MKMANKIIIFYWKKSYLPRLYVSSLPLVELSPGAGGTFLPILVSKYQFFFERQIKLLERFNIKNENISGLIKRGIRGNLVFRKEIKSEKAFKRVVRWNGDVKAYPYENELGKGFFHLYKIEIKQENLLKLNAKDNIYNFLLKIGECDIEKELDNYISNMIANTIKYI